MKKVRTKRTRFFISIIIGLVVGCSVAYFGQSDLALLAGWDSLATVMLIMLWQDFAGHSPSQTASIAKRDNLGKSLLDSIAVLASIASIGAVALLLTARDSAVAHIIFGLASIVLSWALVHALYTLRYASMYYSDQPGGVDFNGHQQPDFKDFAYLSYTIGMTYQVSDTSFTTKEFRRTALGHALLSFVFGTSIIATTINLIASIINGG